MNKDVITLVERLCTAHTLDVSEYRFLIENRTPDAVAYITSLAVEARKAVYQNKVFIRGLIEISNICKNDCLSATRRKNEKGFLYTLLPFFKNCISGLILIWSEFHNASP